MLLVSVTRADVKCTSLQLSAFRTRPVATAPLNAASHDVGHDHRPAQLDVFCCKQAAPCFSFNPIYRDPLNTHKRSALQIVRTGMGHRRRPD